MKDSYRANSAKKMNQLDESVISILAIKTDPKN